MMLEKEVSMCGKFTSYEEAIDVFENRGLYLDTPKRHFDEMNLSKEKLECHCIKHPGIPLEYFFTVVKSGRFGCKACRQEASEKRKGMTIEEKIDYIKSRGYTYTSGDLTRILNPLELICPDGHKCVSSINDLMRTKCVCNICKGKLPANYWTLDKCQEWLDNNDIFTGYKILDIDGNRVFIKCHNEFHEPYWTSWVHIYGDNTICRECYYDRENRKNWTVQRAKELLREYGYMMLDESLYAFSHQRVPCYDEYGFIYMVSIHYILRGRTKFALWKGNPYAVHNIKLFCKLFRPDYEFLSEDYYGSKKEHMWRYIGDCLDDNIYDREFDLKFGHFVNGNGGHPMLSKSKLEAKCQLLLDKYKLQYKTQKTFDGCVYKNKLRFDFYLILNGEEICIETDGMQHEYPVEKFGGLEELAERQHKDKIKNEYCINNNIRLIRIPEKCFKKMEEILIKELHLGT